MQIPGLKQLDTCLWEIGAREQMRVPTRIFASRQILNQLEPQVLEQAKNVAWLPGIVQASLVMPDAHWGYGFPIGGVAAFDPEDQGVICMGGIGYDISCGVRTLRTKLDRSQIQPQLERLADRLFARIPAGLGSQGLLQLSQAKLDQVLEQGAGWAVQQGFGDPQELELIEDQGRIIGADPDLVSQEAKKRQKKQMGTLGSGNHYLEVQYVQEIFDSFTAEAFGLEQDQICVSLHCGSRALGHQVGTDYIQILGRAAQKYNIQLPVRDLVCAPILSQEGKDFYRAMACGINCALANRQILGHLVREVFEEIFPGAEAQLLYDVSHNTCKIETHQVQGQPRKLYVHRKGATRAFGPGSAGIPARYSQVGQPVLIGGTMGTSSYILAGQQENQAWGSACHGAGRAMSRRQALKRHKAKGVLNELAHQGILIRAASKKGAAEEAPAAYKDVNQVVQATQEAGLARKIAKLAPLA
ncbi:MAG: RtcB family protein, partial [Desulfohalobiaceae bacterium]